MNTSRFGVALSAAVVLLIQLACADEPKPGPDRAEHAYVAKAVVQEWIAQLGDARFSVREKAARQLLAADYPAALLLPALDSPNPEVRVRARRILSQQRLAAKERLFAEITVMIREHDIDRFVAAALAHRELFEPELVESVYDFRDDLALTAARIAKRPPPKPSERYFPHRFYHTDVLTEDFSTVTAVFARKCRFRYFKPINLAILVVDGPIEGQAFFSASTGIINGSASLVQMNGSVLFAAGDLDVEHAIWESIVFCGGNVRCRSIDNSVIIAGGTITTAKNGLVLDSTLKPNCQIVSGAIKKFQPAQMGIQTVSNRQRVQIGAVVTDSPFGRAGFRIGDRLVAVNEEAVTSIPQLTEILRRRSVEWYPFAVQVERDGKPLELIVRLAAAK